MILSPSDRAFTHASIPRESGDDPYSLPVQKGKYRYSPRERG